MDLMLGVDVGGTKVAVGAVDRQGEVRGDIVTRLTDTTSADTVLESVIGAVREAQVAAEGRVLGVGIGCAGTVDFNKRMIIQSPNLPLAEEPVAQRLEEAVGLPVVLDNDANVATLAEVRVGVARRLKHVVMLTLGTGVGGGIVIDGGLYRGATGSAGELGHTIVIGSEDVPCLCGARGCLEVCASGTALERFARLILTELDREEGKPTGPPAYEDSPAGRFTPGAALGEASEEARGPVASTPPGYGDALRRLEAQGELTGETVGELALQGDQAAREAVGKVARWLGVGLANFANIFNPEMIVIGGGLSNLGEFLLEPARQVMRETAMAPNNVVAGVEVASLGNTAGVVGAGLVAWEELTGG